MADTAFSSGGTNRARSARKIFFVHPWAPQGGTGGGTVLHSCSLRKYQEKNICPPPWITQGGGHFGCPPAPKLLRRGTILGGGTVPYSHPLYSLLYVVIYKQIQSNLSRISLKGKVQAKLLLKFVKIHQKWSEFWLNYSRSNFSIWNFLLGAKKKLFAALLILLRKIL